ncbi:hypothetical protein RRG08_067245, partial [Elysia crispata]
VTCTTKDDISLDLMFCNVKDSYTSKAMAPPGRSDHNLVSVQPNYRPLVQQEPAIKKRTWTRDTSAPCSKLRTGRCL